MSLTQTPAYVVGVVFRLWSTYWLDEQPAVPPLQVVREGLAREVFFATPLTRKELDAFLAAEDSNREIRLAGSSDWVLNDRHYLGAWQVFSAQARG